MSAPRVLIAGAVLGQPMGGVRRHNQELLPRAQKLLGQDGGGLEILAGSQPLALGLPSTIKVLSSSVPPGPPLRRAFREGLALRRTLERAGAAGTGFDLVHTAHLPAPRRLPVPYCLTIHDLRSLQARGLRGVAAKRVIADAIRRARLVVCVSELVRTEIRDRFQPRATALVGNGADHLPLLPRERASAPFLLHVGHLEPRKDIKTVLQALALDSSLPALWCVGQAKGQTAQELIDFAHHLGLEERLRLLGPLPDSELAELLAQTACVVIPSRLEGFGIPALEALRAGAPLALSRAAAAPHGLAGTVPTFAQGDPKACALAIRSALAGNQPDSGAVHALLKMASWDDAATHLVQAWTQAAKDN